MCLLGGGGQQVVAWLWPVCLACLRGAGDVHQFITHRDAEWISILMT